MSGKEISRPTTGGSGEDKMRIAVIIIATLILIIILPIAVGGWFSRQDSVSSSVCTDCHRPDEIGILTTTGLPISQEYEWQSQLHQALSDPDCLACHTIHGNELQPFQHGLLNASIDNKCALCHIDSMPDDTLHLSASDGCSTCHSPPTWFDVSFEHDHYFRFDSNHPSTCSNCHLVPGDYSQYSCYGACHTEAEIREEHRAGDISDCARCHSSGHED
ncbi:hypothetical protein ACFLTQ_00470 [Chloroflexota bacterium]